MSEKIKEWISIHLAKNPGKVVLASIILLNICFLVVAGLVISHFSARLAEDLGFWEAIFYTITMVLDAGCIQFVIADVGETGVAVILICLAVTIIGMITFTGAVIGYVTNYISDFINNANSGANKIKISDHTVVLNWNTRAAEIINDMLYCEETKKVVVLANQNKEDIEREINECISDTIARENRMLRDECSMMSFFEKIRYLRKHSIRNNIICIVRKGDTYSTKQLNDISLSRARSVIILGNDINNDVCKYNYKSTVETLGKGNAQTIKTLVQVADITGSQTSNDNQKIIVEIDDDWTMDLVNKIINTKQVKGKCNIVPVRVNRILGQILSQFAIMPELNMVYRELFSNKGASFYSKKQTVNDFIEYNGIYMANHRHAIPLTCMRSSDSYYCYYSAGAEKHIDRVSALYKSDYSVKLNYNYWVSKRVVIMLGHNSKCNDIMEGFKSFGNEWNRRDDNGNIIGSEIVQLVVIDDEQHLEQVDYYRQYPFVVDIKKASVYDKDGITEKINEYLDKYGEDISILILSDDTVSNEEIDAGALANLINVQDLLKYRKKRNKAFNVDEVDIIVEILNPKNHDIVTSYSINNVVISNRYISKMLNQIGEKDSLFDLYNDILAYDDDSAAQYESMEVYVKSVTSFFEEIPGPCTADELIRAVYDASIANNNDEIKNISIVLGYVKPNIGVNLFTGNQSKTNVSLMPGDKLIIFSNH